VSEHESHLVPAGDGTFVVVLESGCLECAKAAIHHGLLVAAPDPLDRVVQAWRDLQAQPFVMPPEMAELAIALDALTRTQETPND
jgi:hypothetical protein